MRTLLRQIHWLVVVAAIAGTPALAADRTEASGFYDGTAACPGGDVSISGELADSGCKEFSLVQDPTGQ